MKKRRKLYRPLQKRWCRKVLLCMKPLCLFLLVFNLGLNAAVHSQDQRVSVKLKDAGIEELISAIKSQCEVGFLYDYNKVKRVNSITVDMQNALLKEVLDAALKGTGFKAEIENDMIIIKETVAKDEKKEVRIAGKVMDEKKIPLPGVAIVIKGTHLGTTTGVDGKYSLRLPDVKDITLIFKFLGMETQEIKYTGQDTINVTMKEEKQRLKDVVVTGYNTIRKESFTGNVTKVTKEQLMKTNNKSLIGALQIFDPSVRLKDNSIWGSDPNALPEFNIRGESSIAMAKGLDVEYAKKTQRTNVQDNPNLPVFILDGFEASAQKIYDMDMNRIESVTILKDAAATAMYGSRAANGVIVITTVAPQPGEMRITYSFTGEVVLPDLSDYNLCNAAEKLEVERLSGVFSDDVYGEMEYNKKLTEVLRGVDTDWLALPLRNVFNHKHSFYLEGGVESVRYGLDFNYDSNDGAMRGSYRSRAGAGLTVDFRYKDKLQIRNYVSYTMTRSEDSPYGTFNEYANKQPYLAYKGDDGKLLSQLTDGTTNPLWKTTLESYSGKGHIYDLTDNLDINWYILEGLQFKGQFSVTKNDSKTESFKDPDDPSYQYTAIKEKGQLSRSLSTGYNWNINAMFYYNRAFGKHFVNATMGLNIKESKTEGYNMLFKGFQLGTMNTPAFAATQPDKTDVSRNQDRLFAFLASVNYSLDNIYLLDASVRFDGSSQFGSDKRFAPFWSVGLGVNFHNYKWLQDHWLISTLRIRGSYGSTGKVNFQPYTAVTTYETDADSWYYTGPATKLVYLGNTDLTWEKTNTLDFGINLGFFNDRYTIEANYYHKKTNDLIDQVTIRSSSGFDQYYTNSGSVVNKGFEVNLSATVFQNDKWVVTLTGNMAGNKNEITSLGKSTEEYNRKLNEEYDSSWPSYGREFMATPFTQYYVGASTTAIYAVRSAGIDPANGKEKFIKKNGTSSYTWCADDQVVVGDQSPTANGTFGINVNYRGFYVNAYFSYQWGSQSYNETLRAKVENANIKDNNVDKRVLSQRWKKPGDIAPYIDLTNNTTTKPTSRLVQDDDYLTFSSLSVGYDFKRELLQKISLTSLGIRFNANDLCRWSTIKEERGTSYPYAKNYSFTISVGF
ncbi:MULTISPECIES: SusC/RagA family TonB-linked outer membrane protein [Sanguibacteroides]|uniref:SusC/RagA family TonB-linked outer membrane protein n=1 Tax=Sanguibacteroides justesenii TaxID=1547597 RepID=A0AB34R7G5_9PORP|nr:MULTISPECIES: SusC/RagA family TonB-linked outer membrane protein [Sanguibacteroides]KIO43321.1 hypothetical protein IE90_14170 [Sanguibacteroides justesenii]PXZ42804.1 SusC/RagA family TonB-linked outer membrane protein [Sanguibacteroides justesenii]